MDQTCPRSLRVGRWPRSSACDAPPRHAFTLVELLVVIAIVAVLAAILLPTLSAAKQRAKRVACLNNLRQFVLADLMYVGDHREFPPMSSSVPSSLRLERLTTLAQYMGVTLPPGPMNTWPKRPLQPKWLNCPMAADSGYAEGAALGGGIYTGYVYLGGIEDSSVVKTGFATVVHPGQAADRRNSRRGVLWTDVLGEFLIGEPRRFEFFHRRGSAKYPDFRFHAEELDGFHRGWSDGSVEWVSGKKLNLSGTNSPDLQLVHIFGNYYY